MQTWLPWRQKHRRKKLRGRVLILHGLGDHSSKYTHVAERFAANGYEVVAADAHGHGRSEGLRAYTATLQNYVDDSARVLSASSSSSSLSSGSISMSQNNRYKRQLQPPTFIVAHSLGGAIAIHLTLSGRVENLRGILLAAPAVRVYSNPVLKFFAPVLSTLVPYLPVQKLKLGGGGPKIPPNILALAPGGFNQRIPKDPLLVRGAVRARVGSEVLKSCDTIMQRRNTEKFDTAVFIAHSEHDRVTKAAGSEEFIAKISSRDKTLRKYAGRNHDLLAKKDGNGAKLQVLEDMVKWMDKRAR